MLIPAECFYEAQWILYQIATEVEGTHGVTLLVAWPQKSFTSEDFLNFMGI